MNMKKIQKMSNLSWDERMRMYLENYAQEVFKPELMEELADKFLNYNTVRKTIKQLYPEILIEDILPNCNLIPDNYEEEHQTNKGFCQCR